MLEENTPGSENVTKASPKCAPTESPNVLSRDHQRANVRFTEAEYRRIEEESRVAGLSIPVLLKRVYFRRKPLKLLMTEVDRIFFLSQLNRIGNNLNQLARRVNSGATEGWYAEFTQVAQVLSDIRSMIAGIYGGC